MKKFKKLCMMLAVLVAAVFMSACGTEDVPPGHKAFMFDRTGGLAFYAGGAGLKTDKVLPSGTHWTGFYDNIVGVNCQDSHVKEALPVLTKSDMKVVVDLRVTYSADCDSKESLLKILNQIQKPAESPFVQPPQIFEKYVMPIIRESLRNHLAGVTIEEVKQVRGELAVSVKQDLAKAIEKQKFPVNIDILTVSNINLPESIVNKIKEIEVARMEANKEAEKQRAAKVRLERELFEAQQERKVQKEKSLKEKEVREIEADAELAVKKKQAEGIAEIRRQLSSTYIEYLRLERDAEVRTKMAESLGKGTTYYLSGTEFLVPPGSNNSVAITK